MTSALKFGVLLGTALFLGAASPVRAFEVYSSEGATVRWDNTLKYSAALRLTKPLPALIRDPNSDDGDRNFQSGIVSNRFDLLSEIDLSFASGEFTWGANVSGAAWYDAVYHGKTDASESSPPGLYPAFARFVPPVRKLHGRHAELLNGFVYMGGSVAGMPAVFRMGRHTVLWGESLFFAGNGIAAGQAPIDTIKALSVPVTRAKEVYMPVSQASISLQPSPSISLNAYYQFEWRKSRLPGAGSYFSAADFIDRGGGTASTLGPANTYRGRVTRRPPMGDSLGFLYA